MVLKAAVNIVPFLLIVFLFYMFLMRQMKEVGFRPQIFSRGTVVGPEFAEAVRDDQLLQKAPKDLAHPVDRN